MNKILFISSEAFPLIKTGGLGDVAGSLPPAMNKLAQDIRLLIPGYPEVFEKLKYTKILSKISHHGIRADLIEARLPGSKVPLLVVDCPELYQRTGGPYVDSKGHAWHDNAMRFAFLCYTAVDIATDSLSLDWQPDIVHCNDWQTGLVPALLSLQGKRPASLFTIHNLAYQGVFDYQTFEYLQLPDELWHMDGLEFYGQLSFLKGGLAYADKINTVSPTYAKEILQPENGYGLEGLLQHRKKDLSGILNGIDTKYWNPGTDELIAKKYNRHCLSQKIENKTAMQRDYALPINPDIPLIGMISRLVEQKGLDWILAIMPELIRLPVQFIFLGSGEHSYEQQIDDLSRQYPEKIKAVIGYNESLSHRIEAASDIYLMPSLFEPCGLNQLYSLQYGTLPLVNNVGGLADSVIHASKKNINSNTANGFIMDKPSPIGLLKTVKQAIELYKDKTTWKQLQLNAMRCDFSWHSSAQEYLKLYQQVLPNGVTR